MRPNAPADRLVYERQVVDAALVPVRLDQYVMARFAAYPTRAGARKACERGEFTVEGAVSESSRWLAADELVSWLGPEVARLPPLDVEVPILYEDDYLAMVHKPAGLATSGAHARTLERALVGRLAPSPNADALGVVRAVHRLDAQTQGVLVVAKTRGAHAEMGRAFEERRVQKHYRALAMGALAGEGCIEEPIDDRAARTLYRVVLQTEAPGRGGVLTTVDLFPETGRTHQLRRHLAFVGCPILGDRLYGPERGGLVGKGLFLAAIGLTLPHPVTGEAVTVRIEEPTKFSVRRDREARRSAP